MLRDIIARNLHAPNLYGNKNDDVRGGQGDDIVNGNVWGADDLNSVESLHQQVWQREIKAPLLSLQKSCDEFHQS